MWRKSPWVRIPPPPPDIGRYFASDQRLCEPAGGVLSTLMSLVASGSASVGDRPSSSPDWRLVAAEVGFLHVEVCLMSFDGAGRAMQLSETVTVWHLDAGKIFQN